MRTSGPGNSGRTSRWTTGRSSPGFTLIELLVVVAIIAFATAGVSFALRDSEATQLEREGLRLAALLESAREQSRTLGVPVRWYPSAGGFRFDGLPDKPMPQQWLSPQTLVEGTPVLVLGPEPIIGPQAVVITSTAAPDRSIRVATDGLRPFAVGERQ
ncbi:MAG TPA: prepilin-type N-terminal cleavage/methylation domain-containing protein [Ramlibacter sp.]|uniref:pilus assembly FimT family protein n=1 Tax=Ramlibacter sp. TaxID=1917967 RepID=UPI002C43E823|nr:prepilin-type N-terminal cleavage/methylation domain-containing protein [Ramlibacter sp.]HVZ44275.1 prepilin-type N-terminal cleavage/methylation domain-containing protein [Ramlibacter sp.]